jgi:hypothetical protein
VPAALGAPEHVSVSDDGVVVSMEWAPSAPGAAALRLDQFVGGPAPIFLKRYSDIVEFVTVDGAQRCGWPDRTRWSTWTRPGGSAPSPRAPPGPV